MSSKLSVHGEREHFLAGWRAGSVLSRRQDSSVSVITPLSRRRRGRSRISGWARGKRLPFSRGPQRPRAKQPGKSGRRVNAHYVPRAERQQELRLGGAAQCLKYRSLTGWIPSRPRSAAPGSRSASCFPAGALPIELATLDYVDWFSHQRLFETCADVPPAELETAYYRQDTGLAEAG